MGSMADANQLTEKPVASIAASNAEKGLELLTWCFFLLGGLAVYETLHGLLKAPVPSINLLIVFVVIGFGLKRREARARRSAIMTAGGAFVFYLLNVIYKLANKMQGMDFGDKILFWIMSVFAIISAGWALFTLNRPAVKRLFDSEPQSKPTA